MSKATSAPVPSGRTRKRLRYLSAGVLALVVLGGGLLWLRWPRTLPPGPPSVDLQDAEAGVAEAIESARRSVEQAPTSALAWGRLGMILHAHDFRSEATRCFAQAEKLDPTEPRWPYHQAIELLISDPESGLACLERAADREGPVTSPQLLLGEVLLGQGRSSEAEQHFLRVLVVEQDNPRALYGLARLAHDRGDLASSQRYLKHAVKGAPWVRGIHALLAEVHFRQGDTKAADEERRLVDQLRAETPWPDPYLEEVAALRVGAAAQIALAAQLVRQGRARDGVDLLRETVQQHPESYDAVLALGKTFLRLQPPDYPAAAAALEEAVRRRGDDPAALFHLGIALERQEQFSAAGESYRKAIVLKPDHAYAHYNRGQCLKQQGDPAGALEALRHAVRIKPDFAEGRRDLGELLAQAGQEPEALVQLQQAAQLNPADEKTRTLLEDVRKRKPPPR